MNKKFREELVKISVNKVWNKTKEEWVDTEEMLSVVSDPIQAIIDSVCDENDC